MSMKKAITILTVILASCLLFTACPGTPDNSEQKTEQHFKYLYGVFLGAEPEDTNSMKAYWTIVVEGQSFTKEQVSDLKSYGHTVYSYLNVGSIEEYRPYYDKFSEYTLDVYENWEDEKWVDVTVPEWQDFIVNELAAELKDKGFDGLFIDNVDVYYMYPSEESFEAITSILKALKAMGFYICINGGDVYVSECIEKFDRVDDIFDAVNQETVFTKIIWDEEDTFEEQDREEREYFQEYLKNVHEHGVDVYLLEYSKDKELAAKIKDYCREMGYNYYVSKTLNLDV